MTPCVEWTKFKDKAGYGRRRFVSESVVSGVVNGRIWKHV